MRLMCLGLAAFRSRRSVNGFANVFMHNVSRVLLKSHVRWLACLARGVDSGAILGPQCLNANPRTPSDVGLPRREGGDSVRFWSQVKKELFHYEQWFYFHLEWFFFHLEFKNHVKKAPF